MKKNRILDWLYEHIWWKIERKYFKSPYDNILDIKIPPQHNEIYNQYLQRWAKFLNQSYVNGDRAYNYKNNEKRI